MLTIGKLLVAMCLWGDVRLEGSSDAGRFEVDGHIVYGHAFTNFCGYYDDDLQTLFFTVNTVPGQDITKRRQVFVFDIYLDVTGNTENWCGFVVCYISPRSRDGKYER